MIKELLDNEGKGIVAEIQDNIFNSGANASGQTLSSLKYTVTSSKKGYTLLVDAAIHFPVLEEGRKPGKMPPIKSIIDWTQDRGIPKGAAFGIAKAIAKEGTKLHQEGGRKDIYSNVINDEKIVEILNAVSDANLKESEETIRKQAKGD